MDPQFGPKHLAEEKLATDLADVWAKARMRVGLVAGVVAVGLFQTHFDVPAGEGMLVSMQSILRTAMPVIAIGVFGTMGVWALARRDARRIRTAYEATTFRIPVRKSPKKPR